MDESREIQNARQASAWRLLAERASKDRSGEADKPCLRAEWANALRPEERILCSIAILLCLFPAELRAQTSGETDASPFSFTESLAFCSQSADGCSPNPAAIPPQDSNQIDANGNNSRSQDDWVHSWLRKVDEVRANQPHFVSPIVTTHVLLVQQFRYDVSWQQDPTGNTTTSNYGGSRGLEIDRKSVV